MNLKEYKTHWELEENAPDWAEHTASLISWSRNYDLKNGTPYLVFLDLIGYSEEEYGVNFISEPQKCLGYLELDYLADALKEYANRPQDITDFINRHLALETGDDN